MKLTNAVMADNLSVTKPRKIRDDAVQGFYARFNGRGKADFIMRYRSSVTSKETTFVLGIYGQELGQLSVLVAREDARTIRAEIDKGNDPQISHKNEIQSKRERFNKRGNQDTKIKALTEEYLVFIKDQNEPATIQQKKLAMKRLCFFVGNKLFVDVDKDDALDMLDEIEKKGKCAAMKLIQYSSAFWNWVLEENRAKGINPWRNMKGRKKRYGSKPKTRWLDDEELNNLINVTYPALNPKIQRAVLISLYTNCRPGMATTAAHHKIGMDWSEIKWARKEWSLAASRMKAKKEFVVPLSDQFYTMLREWWKIDGKPKTGPVTPSLTDEKKHMRGDTYSKQIELTGATYTPHDFRRTVSTQLQLLGCPFEIREALRAHTNSGIAGVYDIHNYFNERREWLQKWADHLDTLGFANLAMKAKQDRLQIGLVKHG